eukprot:scaffold219786_cov14-Tisochrysis_lutea.AAC.1
MQGETMQPLNAVWMASRLPQLGCIHLAGSGKTLVDPFPDCKVRVCMCLCQWARVKFALPVRSILCSLLTENDFDSQTPNSGAFLPKTKDMVFSLSTQAWQHVVQDSGMLQLYME